MKNLSKNPFFYLSVALVFLVAFEITGFVKAQTTGQWTAPSVGPTGGQPASPLDASNVPELKAGGTLGVSASSGGIGLSDSLSNFGSLIFGNVSGNAITALAGIRFNGTSLQYSNDGGSTWKNIGGLGDTLPVVINSPSSGANGLIMENSGTNGHNTPFVTWSDDSSGQKFSIRSDNGNIYMGTGDTNGFNGYFSMDIKGNITMNNATGNQYSPKSGYWWSSSCDTYSDPTCSPASYQKLSCDTDPTSAADCSTTNYTLDTGGSGIYLTSPVTNPTVDGTVAYNEYTVTYDTCNNPYDPHCPQYQTFDAYDFYTYGTKNILTSSATNNTATLTLGGMNLSGGVFDGHKVVPNGSNVLYNCQAVVAGNGNQSGSYTSLDIGQSVTVSARVNNGKVQVNICRSGYPCTGYQNWVADVQLGDQKMTAGWGYLPDHGIQGGWGVAVIDDAREFFATRYSTNSGNTESVYRCELGLSAQ